MRVCAHGALPAARRSVAQHDIAPADILWRRQQPRREWERQQSHELAVRQAKRAAAAQCWQQEQLEDVKRLDGTHAQVRQPVQL
eukprot:365143-Chlamydomonas_euryale.AAC.11